MFFGQKNTIADLEAGLTALTERRGELLRRHDEITAKLDEARAQHTRLLLAGDPADAKALASIEKSISGGEISESGLAAAMSELDARIATLQNDLEQARYRANRDQHAARLREQAHNLTQAWERFATPAQNLLETLASLESFEAPGLAELLRVFLQQGRASIPVQIAELANTAALLANPNAIGPVTMADVAAQQAARMEREHFTYGSSGVQRKFAGPSPQDWDASIPRGDEFRPTKPEPITKLGLPPGSEVREGPARKMSIAVGGRS